MKRSLARGKALKSFLLLMMRLPDAVVVCLDQGLGANQRPIDLVSASRVNGMYSLHVGLVGFGDDDTKVIPAHRAVAS